MKIHRIYKMYFSATGTTEKVVSASPQNLAARFFLTTSRFLLPGNLFRRLRQRIWWSSACRRMQAACPT